MYHMCTVDLHICRHVGLHPGLDRCFKCHLLKFWVNINFKGPMFEHWLLFFKAILLSNEFTAKIPLQVIFPPLFFKISLYLV